MGVQITTFDKKLKQVVTRELRRQQIEFHTAYATHIDTGTRPRSFVARKQNEQLSKKQACFYCGCLVVPIMGKCKNCNAPMVLRRSKSKPTAGISKTQKHDAIIESFARGIAMIICMLLAVGLSVILTYIFCLFGV